MSTEDKKWLENAMHEFTFNDADKLKKIAEELAESIKDGFAQKDGSYAHHVDQIDEL
jgi:Zn-dependent M16 (insulinase) family peptidase